MPLTLTTESLDRGDDRAVQQRLVGCRHVAHLGGRERVEDVGQPAPVDRVAQRVVDRRARSSGTARSTACTSADWRTWLDTCGNGELASGEATIHATSSTAAAETTAPATESTIFAGSQVTRERSARPDRAGDDLAQQRPGQDDDERGEHPGDAGPVDPVGDRARTAARRAPRRRGSPTIEVAETSSPWRNPERANSSARAISTRSTTDTSISPAPSSMPTCPSWTWKLHSNGWSPGAVTSNSMVSSWPGRQQRRSTRRSARDPRRS